MRSRVEIITTPCLVSVDGNEDRNVYGIREIHRGVHPFSVQSSVNGSGLVASQMVKP